MAASPFMTAMREHMLARHYSLRTIDGYLYWIRYYIRFHGKRHPAELDQSHVMAFLGFIASTRKVSVSTQKTALNALAFLYNKYPNKPHSRPVSKRTSPAILCAMPLPRMC